MGDSENNSQPSKKRAAGVQLSRDNAGLDENEDLPEQEAGTFRRASEDVLATRRIVKVRRQQTSSTPAASVPDPPPASNPFAAIRLVSPTPPPVDKESEKLDNNTGESENKVDQPKGDDSTAKEEKTDNANEQSEEIKVDQSSKPEQNPQKDETDDVTEQNITKSAVEEVAEGENTEDVPKKDIEETEDNKEKDNQEANLEKNAENASFGSFQQLSSGQNAFSGLSGTGFSATSFSFGSFSKDGPPTTSLFGFGTSNNGNSSIFGATSVTNTVTSTKFPPMNEVTVETGEENEKAVFTADSVLFEYTDGAWKERGKGELKLNIPTIGGNGKKARLVMRAKGNYRLILNASLFPDMKLTSMDKKGITFACVNSAAEGKEGLSTIALKFKDPSIVEAFRGAVGEHKDKTPAVKTPENSPKASDE